MKDNLRFTFPESLWAGDGHSLAIARDAHSVLMAGGYTPNSPAEVDNDEDKDAPYSFSRHDNVGVISIRGSLVNTDSPYNKYYGVISYAEIARGLVYAAKDPKIGAILLDIDSGGGAVSGCADTGNLIKRVHAEIKPVYAFAGNIMASAAMWLGASAGHVSAGISSLTGSIGVISTHIEVSKMLEEAGIKATVFREGEFKALASQFEVLTEPAKKQIQARLVAAYGLFIDHMAECRHMTVDAADKSFGQGREFFGKEALAVNLVDAIHTFDSLMGAIQAKLDIDSSTSDTPTYFPKGHTMATPRAGFTPQQIAALAAGATLGADVTGTTPVTPPVAAPAAAPVAAPAAQTAAPAQTATPAAPNEGAAAGTNSPAPGADMTRPQGQAATDPVLSYFQGQVTTLSAEVATAKAAAATAQTRIAELEANQAALATIATSSLSHMKVALGHAAVVAGSMTVPALLAEHANTAKTFTDQFKAGGVAATGATTTQQTASALNDPLRSARIAASRVTRPTTAKAE